MNVSPFPTPFLVRSRLLLLAAIVSGLAPMLAGAQPGMPTGANYTNDMPSVAKVQATIQGTSPADTAARQVTVFDYLIQYINRVQTNRSVRAGYTPAEGKLIGEYSGASAQIKQNFPKSHTAAEVAEFNRGQGKYLFDDAFMSAWPKQLIGKQASVAIQNANAGLNASAKKMYDQQMQDLQQAQQAQQQGTAVVNGQVRPMSNDPTAVGIRRCLELGGSTGSCMGGGLINGMLNLVTGGQGTEAITGPGRTGVVLSGSYTQNGTPTYVGFSGDTGSIGSCGKLVPDNTIYTVSKTTTALKVTLPVSPTPVTLTMRSDGSLQGPGAITLNGQIITGYNIVTTTRTGNCAPNCVTTTRTPIYAPATDRCSVGALKAPAPPPQSANASGTPPMGGMLSGVIDTLTGAMTATMPGTGPSLPGLRMEGKYGSSGLQLDFAGDAVTLDCGAAHVKSPYTVENAPSSLIVHVKNSGGPFDLVVSSDNTLRGSGSTTVNGRLVSGMNGTDITYTPRSETCQVATYTPQMGSRPTTAVAANASPAPAPASAVPASYPTATTSAAPVSAATPSTGSMTLAITSSFPIAKNPLAGAIVKLMTDRFDNVLRKAGAAVPAGITPGQALLAYVTNCPPPTGCPAAAQKMKQYYVGTATFDNNGAATIHASVPPGNYYIICTASGTTGGLVWDLPVTLKAGQNNSIGLTATNAELVK